MDNTWYYTLTTIAQTLAAILGLAAVFATIRLKDITDMVREYRRIAYYVIKVIEEHKKIDALKSRKITDISASGLWDILNKIRKDYPKEYIGNTGIEPGLENLAQTFYPHLKLNNLKFIEDTTYYLRYYIKQRNNLVKVMKWPGIVSAGTIIYTIFLLSISNIFYCDKIFAQQLFTFAVIFSILSILLIVDASWKLLKESAEKI